MVKTTVNKVWNGKQVKIQGRKVVGRTCYEAGLVIEGDAKLLCPVDYGYLRASITTQSSTQGTEIEVVSSPPVRSKITFLGGRRRQYFNKIDKPTNDMETDVGTPVYYAPYVEFLDQPFLRPALDLAKGKEVTIYEKMKRGKEFHEFSDYLVPRGSKSK